MPDSTPGDSNSGLANFFSTPYQVHNHARLTHLDSLGLPLANRRVLELGSGPGDHTGFYVQRGCAIVSVDARQDCLDVLKERYPGVQIEACDLNDPAALLSLGSFDVIHCYGVLYHLEKPSELIRFMGEACSGLAIVETCVRADHTEPAGTVDEPIEDFTQSSTGRGNRPARAWVLEALGRSFPFVYQTRTQPNHPEFPVDWRDLTYAPPLTRAVFVASRQALDLPSLSPNLLDVQQRLDPAAYIAVLESMLADARAILKERDQLCVRLDREAGDLRKQVDEKEKLFQRLHLEGGNLRNQIETKEQLIQRLHLEAGDRRGDLEKSEQLIQRLHLEGGVLRNQLEEKEELLQRLHVEAGDLRRQLECAVTRERESHEQ